MSWQSYGNRDCLDEDCSSCASPTFCSPRSQKNPGGGQACGLTQLRACLSKNFTEKRRNLRVTLCEGLSHLLIVVILFLGYRISKIRSVDSGDYSQIRLTVPPIFLTQDLQKTTELQLNLPKALKFVDQLLEGPVVIPDLQQYLTLTSTVAPIYARLDPFARSLVSSTYAGSRLANILNRGVFHFAPAGPTLLSLLRYLNATTPIINKFKIYTHNSESEAIRAILSRPQERTFALLVMREVSPSKVNYVIRMNYTTLPNTNAIVSRSSLGLNKQYQNYILSGFLSLQRTIDTWAFIKTGAANTSDVGRSAYCRSKPEPFVMPFPTAKYSLNPFYSQVGFLLGLGLTMATLYPVSRLVKSLVEEKETRMREIMKIMGLLDYVHLLSWFITAFVLFFWIALSSSYVCSASFLKASNTVLVFAYFFLFAMSEITFCFFLSVFFSNAKLAAIAAPVLLFTTILPRFIFFSTNNEELFMAKYAASLLSPTAFTFGADIIANAEFTGIGVQWSNMFDEAYSFGGCLGMMFVDFWLYGFLAIYFDQVLPSEYGTKKHPLFFLSWRFWCPAVGEAHKDYATLEDDFCDLPEFPQSLTSVVPDGPAEGAANMVNFEPLDSSLLPSAKVRISGLRKQYPDGKLAVKSLSMAMLEGQITCLLGSNGAGKTSTISILTGLFEATSGNVSIYGRRLDTELQTIRQMTGLCPQHNVLVPCLTVCEHLQLFGRIKGITGHALRAAIDNILSEVGLTEKKHVVSQALSGGMKRKLSLSIALIGDPKFVLLDEPTSGMDPYSRRSTWELLQRSKKNRVILLTTHFMDEADTLGDRIMIMSEGRLRCSGSPLFLKNRFGAGYVLSMAKASPTCDAGAVEAAIKEVIPAACLAQAVAGELLFQLPLTAVSQFPALFHRLKADSHELGISSYGVSITTLEQVFIRLAKEAEMNYNAAEAEIEEDIAQTSALYRGVRDRLISIMLNLGRRSIPNPQGFGSFPSEHSAVQGSLHGVEFTSVATHDDGEAMFDAMGVFDGDEVAMHSEERQPVSVVHEVASMASIASITSIEEKCDTTLSTYDPPHSVTVDFPHDKMTDSLKQKPSPVIPPELADSLEIIPSPELSTKLKTTPRSGSVSLVGLAVTPPAVGMLHPNAVHYSLSKVVPGVKDEEGLDTHPVHASAFINMPGALIASYWQKLNDHIVFIQLVELLRKRYIIASRDIKGFIFQVIFPTIQIALVLAVLTVSFSPAGRTIRMLGSTFKARLGVTAGVVVGSRGSSGANVLTGAYASSLSQDSGLNIVTLNCSSTFGRAGLSEGLLRLQGKKSTRSNSRYGAYQYNDSVLVNVSVSWTWVRANLPFILQNQALIESTSALLGVPLDLNQQLFGSAAVAFALPPTFNASTFFSANNITDASTETARSIVGTNTTVSQLTLLINNATAIGAPVRVSGRGAKYNPVTGLLSITGASVIVGNTTTALGNVSLPAVQIVQFLPTTTELYTVIIPSLVSIMHNSSSPHAQAIFYGELQSDAFSACSPGRGNGRLLGSLSGRPVYTVKNHPLPLTTQQTLEIKIIISLFASLFILIPLCYIPASFTAFVVRERSSKSLHLQYVSGVSPYVYWIATFMWDAALYFLLTSFVMIAFFCYGRESAEVFISTNEASSCVFLLIILYGLSCIPLSYLYSFLFDNHSTAQISIMTWNFLTGFVAVLAYFIMTTIPETRDAAKQVVHFFRFFPPYLVGEGLVALSSAFFLNIVARRNTSYYSWEVAGRPMVFMFIEMVGYFSLVLLSESSYVKRASYLLEQLASQRFPTPVKPLDQQDSDVVAEKERLQTEDPSSFALFIRGLSKCYSPVLACGQPKHAVKDVNFACLAGERFGLLGINGAGKSTTLGILTGDVQATHGDVYVCGIPLSDPSTRQLIGYCPQVDPLLDLMNAYETLWFFGRIRGIDKEVLRKRVDDLILQVGLSKHAKRPSGTYSGGNKRKLSLAIALVGDPKVLFLDEPSTGMDPEARRNMWTVIEQVSSNRSIVLVSHSMEECEALCTRMCVMVSGRLQCLGSSQHIKGKFGATYQLEVRVHKNAAMGNIGASLVSDPGLATDPVDAVLELCRATLPGCAVDERHSGFLRLQLDGSVDLAVAFDLLESNKERLGILDYSISQATLEQVFIKFAKDQEEERGAVRGLSGGDGDVENGRI